MLDTIHYKKFPYTELQGKVPCSEKPSRNSCHESNTSNPKPPISVYYYKLLYYLQTSMWQHSQYNDQDIHWKIWCSNLGSEVASADGLTTHICRESSSKINGAMPPLNLSASMAHIATTLRGATQKFSEFKQGA
jgi:hypothetical protein